MERLVHKCAVTVSLESWAIQKNLNLQRDQYPQVLCCIGSVHERKNEAGKQEAPARFRYSDLSQAVRGCGGRGTMQIQ